MSLMNWESKCKLMLDRNSVMAVLDQQIAEFAHSCGSKPEIMFMPYALRPAMVTEIIRTLGLPADVAIAEPFWYDGVPLLFSNKQCAGDYLVLRSSAARKEVRL